jgi:hypothetical protein
MGSTNSRDDSLQRDSIRKSSDDGVLEERRCVRRRLDLRPSGLSGPSKKPRLCLGMEGDKSASAQTHSSYFFEVL